jgi:pyridoxine kinase
MTVAFPILSACGHETCILPTALLSTHTGGFTNPVVQNLTGNMAAIRDHWYREGINFDLIYTGYLGSVEAIWEVKAIIDLLLSPGGRVIVDPAMADHGKLYRGLDETYAEEMKELCSRADLILPNITEAAMMTGQPFREELDEEYVRQLLSGMEGKQVLMTGVGFSENETGFALKTDAGIVFSHHARLNRSYHGTGDLFASAFVGALASGKKEFEAARIASEFTLKSIRNTYENPAHSYGVKFETALPDLIDMLR